MAKEIKTNIVLGGKVAASLQKAFKTTEKETQQLEQAYNAVKNVGVKAFNAIAVAAAGVTATVLASAEATRDYRKDLAKMYNNAEMAGIAQKEAWSGLEDLYAMSGEFDSANEAMSNLIATGYKGKDLEKIIEAVNGATVKWQDTVTQESLADAINETVMSGKSIGQFDEILSRSGVNIDTFNDGLLACNGLAERQQYVLDWLAKSGLTDVNEAYQEQNKSIVDAYKADLKYQDSMAKLGTASEGLTTTLKNLGAGGIEYIASKIEGIDLDVVSDALKEAGELGKEAFDLIWEALSKIDWETLISSAVTVLRIFTSIFNFIVSNWSAISPIIYGVVGAMVAYKAITIGVNTVTAISTALKTANAFATARLAGMSIKQAASTAIATAAQGGLNLAFLACPITWIVLGIAAIIAIIAVIAKKVGGFKELWNICWDGIVKGFEWAKKAIGKGIDWISEKIEGLINWFEGIGDWFSNLFGGGEKSINVSAKAEGKSKTYKNALGGTYSSPIMTWVAEGGDTETIVPHNSKPRSQALALEAVRGTGVSVGGGNQYVYSPTIYASGKDESTIRGILADEFAKFKAQIEAWEQEKARVSY